jgi:PTH1 family peptidyl-tRNA hydrolase
MKLIVGLGNPGKKYIGTRHNAGFVMIEKIVAHKEFARADAKSIFSFKDKFKAQVFETTVKGEKFIFVKPGTFMNLSGDTVASMLDFYNLDLADLIVCHDDIDLLLGTARIRSEGTSGGHKGIQNIIERVGSQSFARVRLGIAPISDDIIDDAEVNFKPDTADFVLGKFNPREVGILKETIDEAILYILPSLFGKEPLQSHTIEIKFDGMK